MSNPAKIYANPDTAFSTRLNQFEGIIDVSEPHPVRRPIYKASTKGRRANYATLDGSDLKDPKRADAKLRRFSWESA